MKQVATSKKDTTTMKAFNEVMKTQITKAFNNAGKALTTHLTPDRAYMFINMSMRSNPKLLECSVNSLITSLMATAMMGLDIAAGEAYIVPYWNTKLKGFEAVPIVGYKGDLKNIYRFKLDKNTPLVKSVEVFSVHEKDFFKVTAGSDSKIVHEPDFLSERGAAVAYYAIAQMTGGGFIYHIMTTKQIREHAEKFSKSKDKTGKLYGVWIDHFDSMAKKTVIHQLKKLLPSSFIESSYVDTEYFDERRVTMGDYGMPEPINEDLEPEDAQEVTDLPPGTNPDTGEIQDDKKDDTEDDGDPFVDKKEEKKAAAEPPKGGGLFGR